MQWKVYLRGNEYTDQTLDLKLERKRSRLYSASGKIVGFSESEYNAIVKTDEITIRSANSPRNNFQGQFYNLSYDAQSETLNFSAYNFPAKLQNVVWIEAEKEWTDTAFETIIDYILNRYDWSELWWSVSSDSLKNLVVGFKIKNEPIWKAITRLLKQVGATWYGHPDPWSESQKKFTQEKLYFDTSFYSKTEEISSYVEKTLVKKYDRLINYIKVLGNNISSTDYHATTIRSHLANAITADATTIVLDDASDFPETSNTPIRIGTEILLYESKSGNTLTGCLRAQNGTTAYAHNKGVEVYSAEYDKDNPQSGSSIATNGIASATLTDRTVTDQNTLDFLAQDVIANYYDYKEVAKVKTIHTDDLDLTIDDKMTVDGTTDDIYEFLYQDSDLLITLTAGDTYEPFLDEIASNITFVDNEEEYSEFNDLYTITDELYTQVGTVTAINGDYATVKLESGETITARII